MITLHKYVPYGKTPDMSPFCIKVETYLKMTNRPYVTKVGDPRKTPKKKLPVVEADGKTIADSRFIVEYLEGQGDALDAALDPKQRALLTAVRSMLEEHMYWIAVHFRWKEEDAWALYRPVFDDFAAKVGVPKLMVPLMMPMIRRDMLRAMHAQGSGRHSRDELVKIGKEIIDSVAELMSDGPYFFGDKPSTLDSTVYAFFWVLLDSPGSNPLAEHARTKNRIVAYVDRMMARYWQNGASA